MGIGRFFKTLVDEFPGIKGDPARLPAKQLHVDFNSIVHDSFAEANAALTGAARHVSRHIAPALTHERIPNDLVRHIREVEAYPVSRVLRLPLREWTLEHNVRMWQDTASAMISERVVLRLERLLAAHVQVHGLHLYVDGVPHVAKMHEQKSRKLFGALIEEGRTVILCKVADNERDDSWYFENDVVPSICFARNAISPGTAFMRRLVGSMRSSVTLARFRRSCPQISVHISDDLEEGEGEHKMMRVLRLDIHGPGTISVYSPDADMIVLLLNDARIANHCDLLRVDQATGALIRVKMHTLIDSIRAQLNTYMHSSVHKDKDKTIKDKDGGRWEKALVLKDVCALYIVFGNDFVRGLNGVQVDADFASVTSVYVRSVLSQGLHLVKTTEHGLKWDAVRALMVSFAHTLKDKRQKQKDKQKFGGNASDKSEQTKANRHKSAHKQANRNIPRPNHTRRIRNDWFRDLATWSNQLGPYRTNGRHMCDTRDKYYRRYFPHTSKRDAIVDYLLSLKYNHHLYDGVDNRLVRFWFYPHAKSPLLEDIAAFMSQGHDIAALLVIREREYFESHPIKFEYPLHPSFQQIFTSPTFPILVRTVHVTEKILRNKFVQNHFKANEVYLKQVRWDTRVGALNVKKMFDCSDCYFLNKCLPLQIHSDTIIEPGSHPIDLFNALFLNS
jgi:XRN 5'-3' exonuclease N-terminus